MFIVTTSPDALPSSVGAAWMGILVPGRPPRALEQTRIHAAPTELGDPCGTYGYKHGAPNGAFRIAATLRRVKDACKVQRERAHSGLSLTPCL